jgi:hypothetical protein
MHHYCSPAVEGSLDLGAYVSPEKEVSKELTQKEISIISTNTSDGDIQLTSADGDIIQHHTPSHKVSLAMRC